MTNPTCTVLFSTGPCGRPAVSSFTTAEGKTYWECADHDASPRLLGRPGTSRPVGTVLRTRSTAPYALVADSPTGPTIVGYARSTSLAVDNRARRLGAKLLPIEGGQVVVPS